MPIYNKASQIEAAFSKLFALTVDLDFMVSFILVNDGSTDRSMSLCQMIVEKYDRVEILNHELNLGKGAALRTGFKVALRAEPDLIAYIDADLDIDPKCLIAMLVSEPKNEGIRVGSKRHSASQVTYPFIRRLLSTLFQMITRLLLSINCRDSQTGVKVFSRKCLEEILGLSRLNSFSIDLELLTIATAKGYKIEEFPVRIDYKFESSVGIKNSLQALTDILTIKKNFKSWR
jgi:glycosyltransferase involved in cell wall biosynthesis